MRSLYYCVLWREYRVFPIPLWKGPLMHVCLYHTEKSIDSTDHTFIGFGCSMRFVAKAFSIFVKTNIEQSVCLGSAKTVAGLNETGCCCHSGCENITPARFMGGQFLLGFQSCRLGCKCLIVVDEHVNVFDIPGQRSLSKHYNPSGTHF